MNFLQCNFINKKNVQLCICGEELNNIHYFLFSYFSSNFPSKFFQCIVYDSTVYREVLFPAAGCCCSQPIGVQGANIALGIYLIPMGFKYIPRDILACWPPIG